MVTDRVGDFIIRLQNAARARKPQVVVPYSGHLLAVAKKLKELGFLSTVETVEKEGSSQKNLVITLASNERGAFRLRGVHRISKPGRRLYVPHTKAHRIKGGTGARIISSPSGIVSDTEARKLKVGGEELFEIW